MRMRKKPNLIPRMERCASVLEREPEKYFGHWLETFKGYKELHLELGCGKGKFTAEMAARNPDILFVAVERVPDAMVIAMERVFAQGLENVRFIDMDGEKCGEIFAPGEVDRIYINFPDPWRKKKQFKRRLTAPSFLKLYESILKPESEIWFKTDNAPLFEWSLEQFKECGWNLFDVTNDLHAGGINGIMTDYETKFYTQGLPINRCRAQRPDNAAGENDTSLTVG